MSIRDLTREQLEEALISCGQMFRSCLAVLNGSDVEEVPSIPAIDEMGDSDDLELFYQCKCIVEALNVIADEDEN